jgi:hypothetical protein
LEEHFDEKLSFRDEELVKVIGLANLNSEEMLMLEGDGGRGRPSHSRSAILRAFIAKSVYGFWTNNQLIDYCGLEALCENCVDLSKNVIFLLNLPPPGIPPNIGES